MQCKVNRYNFQIYGFLEFPLKEINNYFYEKGKRQLNLPEGKNSDVTLDECFEYNQRDILMSGDNQIYCNKCRKSCDCTFTTFLYSCPDYLIISFNRGKGATYECNVNFPESLNLSKFSVEREKVNYELYAVICHIGPSSMIGHFVSYCKNRIDNQWYLYNDALVGLYSKPIQDCEGMPYILFYRCLDRRNKLL